MSEQPNAIEQAAGMLPRRTLAVFKRAHILQAADGTRLNLDWDVAAADDAGVIAAMREKAASWPLDAPLPAAPSETWERFVSVGDDPRYRRTFGVRGLAGMRRAFLSVVVRIEHA